MHLTPPPPILVFPLVLSTLLSGAASHKSLAGEHSLLRFYYTAPYALFSVCLLNEACLLAFYLLPHEAAFEAAVAAHVPALTAAAAAFVPALFTHTSVLRAVLHISFPVFALKQLFSVLQLISAARRVLAIDEARRARA